MTLAQPKKILDTGLKTLTQAPGSKLWELLSLDNGRDADARG